MGIILCQIVLGRDEAISIKRLLSGAPCLTHRASSYQPWGRIQTSGPHHSSGLSHTISCYPACPPKYSRYNCGYCTGRGSGTGPRWNSRLESEPKLPRKKQTNKNRKITAELQCVQQGETTHGLARAGFRLLIPRGPMAE